MTRDFEKELAAKIVFYTQILNLHRKGILRWIWSNRKHGWVIQSCSRRSRKEGK